MVACIHLSRYLPARIDQHVIETLRNRAVDALLRAHPQRVAAYPSGDLVSRVQTDAGTLDGLAGQALKQLVGPALILIGSLGFMFALEWRLALALVLGVPLVAALLAVAGSAIRSASARAQRQAGALAANLVEQVQGILTIRTMGTESSESELFRRHSRAYRGHTLRSAQWSAALVSSVWMVATTALLAAIYLGSRQITAGQLTSGGLLAFCLFAGQAVDALRNLGAFQGRLAQLAPAAERVLEVVDLPADDAASASELPALGLACELRGPLLLDRVRFAYPEDDRDVLRDVSLRVEPGETVALVGATGGGKTTLVRLLLALHRPSSGRILLAGRDLVTIPPARLYRAIAVVPQEPFLFARTLRENLTYGAPDATAEQLAWAIASVELETLVAEARAGLDTPVRELGASLSGGQRQRIVLARTLLRDPPLLLLDEATSALDSETEAAIWTRLEGWLARRTVLVFAHRLATVHRVPRVVLLEDGRVRTDGPTAAVLRDDEAFRRLFGEQLALAREGAA
jgi:ATP-binding cassette subfamily B protein